MKLLQALRSKYPHISQTQARTLLQNGLILHRGRKARITEIVDDPAQLSLPDAYTATSLTPNPRIALPILQETADFVFVAKPAGVHAVAQNFADSETVANALLHTHPELAALHPLECGLAHRLDRETSGVMVAAKHQEASAFLRTAFAEHRVQKIYSARVHKAPLVGLYDAYALDSAKSAERVRLSLTRPLTQKNLKTLKTRILSVQNDKSIDAKSPLFDAPCSRVQLELITGYRHQIRAHLALLGHPLWGDTLYGSPEPGPFFLHAETLTFVFNGQTLTATAPCPF